MNKWWTMSKTCSLTFSLKVRHYSIYSTTMIREWENIFKSNGIEDYKMSAYHLITSVINSDRELRRATSRTTPLDEQQIKDINLACHKRLKRMPVQYILGQWDFRNLTLLMRPPVFIPRPETEDLVDIILNSLSHTHPANNTSLTFLDMCTGSGSLCISLCHENIQLKGYAIDIMPQAVQLARDNSILNGVSERIKVYESSVNDSIKLFEKESFDFIVSNPPYIPTNEISSLQPEIINYEDHRALDGGKDGTNIIKQVISTSSLLLKPHGCLWLETGLGQNIELLSSHLSYVQGFNDYTGRMRFHLLQKQ